MAIESIRILHPYTRMALIPHAGKQYAGDARATAFRAFSSGSVRAIVYIAALHQSTNSNKIYELHRDPTFPDFGRYVTGWDKWLNQHHRLPLHDTPRISEHSWEWVREEIESRFPHVPILVLAPDIWADLEKLSLALLYFLDLNSKHILLGTTDLIHYGDRFGNVGSLGKNVQAAKIRNEEPLLDRLTEGKSVRKLLGNHTPTCGPRAVETLARVASLSGWRGRVVDYYDSHGGEQSHFLDRYTVSLEPVDSFVSYASVVFGDYPDSVHRALLPLDINIGLGAVKTTILASLKRIKSPQPMIPSWCRLHLAKNGVFVGTSNHKGTTCCRGTYEGVKSLANNIINAAKSCPDDTHRWNHTYTIPFPVDTVFKMEILEARDTWKTYPAKDAIRKFSTDGRYGMLLTIPGVGSATYLPSVAAEGHWEITDYMRSLTKKAGGSGDEWNKSGSTIQVYQSHVSRSHTDSVQVEREI